MTSDGSTRLSFGEFQVDLRAGELFRGGVRVPLQEKPFRVLSLLLRNAGQMVSRKSIFEEVWCGTYVQEDQSLNTAMRKVRLALGDSADQPQYIETVGSRGYRFVHPVETHGEGPLRRRGIRLAILPFQNLGPELQEHFSDGMTEEMIACVGRMHPHLSVIAPSSVMRYKNTARELSEILEELGVDYVLSGSVRRVGTRVRIATQLVNGADQTCIWSDSCERDVTDLFAFTDEVAERIVRSTLRLLGPDGVSHATNSAAHECYLRGRYFWNKRSAPALLKSIDCFQQASTHDPGYALSYVGLGDAYLMLAHQGIMAPLSALPKAKEAAVKALELDPELAEAYVPLAWVKAVLDRDFVGAEADCRKAIQRNPSHAFAYVAYAFVLGVQGRHSEGLSAVKRALHLDPVSLPTNMIYASQLYFARQYDTAIEQCKECFELDPNFAIPYAIYGQALEQKGQWVEAIQAFERERELAPWSPLACAHLARVHAQMGAPETARHHLDNLLQLRTEKHVPSYFIALVYAALGDDDGALEWLLRADEERSNWILFSSVDPKIDTLRTDSRFVELLRKVGLPLVQVPRLASAD
jgi:TolB-like protein/Flp pilus assembly protein TadD